MLVQLAGELFYLAEVFVRPEGLFPEGTWIAIYGLP